MILRHAIADNHPVIGSDYRLVDDDVLIAGDETACVSTLLSLNGDRWRPIPEEWIGQTIDNVLSADADADERLFRRQRNNFLTIMSKDAS